MGDRMDSIENHLIFISGFLQKTGSRTNGIHSLQRMLHRKFVNANTAMLFCTWNADFEAIASQIRNCVGDSRRARIVVTAYSWGVGVGALRLARALSQYGLRIEVLFSIDGVYRPFIPVPIRSMFSRWNPFSPKIRIPSHINKVVFWRQNKNRPQGHRLVPSVPSQEIIPGIGEDGLVVGEDHQTIDNNIAIHDSIISHIEKLQLSPLNFVERVRCANSD